MRLVIITFTLHAPWAHSLKEKRAETKSLLARIKNKFNVSAVESGTQDSWQTITITVAALAAGSAQADSTAQNIIRFIESATQAEIIEIQKEILLV